MSAALRLQSLFPLLLLLLFAGCRTASPPAATASPPDQAKSPVLQKHWKIINFGAPW